MVLFYRDFLIGVLSEETSWPAASPPTSEQSWHCSTRTRKDGKSYQGNIHTAIFVRRKLLKKIVFFSRPFHVKGGAGPYQGLPQL